MNKILPSTVVASMIAGGGIGTSIGIMTKGEQLEEQGADIAHQALGSLSEGLVDGVIGVGVGAGVSGTAVALKNFFTRR